MKDIKRQGLRVSPCLVPRLMGMGGVVVKFDPWKDVVE